MSLYIPCISFKPRKISHYCYNLNTSKGHRRKLNPYRVKNSSNTGLVHFRKKERIQNAVQVLYDTSDEKRIYVRERGYHIKFRLNFITLTLPSKQNHTDAEIHKNIFIPFIRRIKSRIQGFAYVYRAETQENGNIHYHLASNQFIHYSDLSAFWDYYCMRFGYRANSPQAHSATTQVKAMYKIRDCAAYIAKYMSKNGEKGRRKVDIKEWDCTLALKSFKIDIVEPPNETLKLECKKIHYALKSTRKYQYATIQSVSYSVIANIAPVIASYYQNAISSVKEKIEGAYKLTSTGLPKLALNT